jgi:phosphoribosylanthranilate isomerase
MLVKICGLREVVNIEEISQIKPDFMGFIFYEKSPRYASDTLSEKQIRTLPQEIIPTGVFVNETEQNIALQVKRFGLRAVQLHGEESAEFCRNLRTVLGSDFWILKAFGIRKDFDFKILKNYEPWVQYFLFDTKTEAHGGSGQSFDWDILKMYKGNTPYFLSGGIGLEEILELKKEIKTMPHFKNLIGLDLNSKLEDSPGNKNFLKVKEAIHKTRNINL